MDEFSFIGDAGWNDDERNLRLIKELELLKLGDVAVDVGANAGSYTTYFSAWRGATGRIYSIEIMPNLYNFLEMTYGHLENTKFINAAISDTNGIESVYDGGSFEACNIVGYSSDGRPNHKIGEIRSITLDTLLQNEPEIALIKIDVEGAELKVLKGMTETVKKTDAILIEIHFDEDWPEIRKILLEDFNLLCYNVGKEEEVTMDSPRAYQCLCRRKNEDNSL